MNTKLHYLLSSALHSLTVGRYNCPDCGSHESMVLDRKYIFTQFRRCAECQLCFRTPTMSAEDMEKFHQTSYRQGLITDLPTSERLSQMLASDFANTQLSYARYFEVLSRLGLNSGLRVYEFGSSWGYGASQFGQRGFHTSAWEIDSARREYAARELGVVHTNPDEVGSESRDLLLSAHVIEHVARPRELLDFATKTIVPGGIALFTTPNGSMHFRKEQPFVWHSFWGLVHPQLLDEHYLQKWFEEQLGLSVLLTSNPEEIRHDFIVHGQISVGSLCQDELWIVIQKQPL